MKSYFLVVLAIAAIIADAYFHLTECDMTRLPHESLTTKSYMNLNNKNELHTHQGVDPREMQKSQLSIERTLY